MTNLNLVTIQETKLATASWLTFSKDAQTESVLCVVIEDGYNPVKIKGSTRIPEGRYQLVKKRDGRVFGNMKKKFGQKWVIEVVGVPNYSGIIFHPGNSYVDTKGCPLPNTHYRAEGENLVGEKSTEAYLELYKFVGEAFTKGEVWLNVVRDFRKIL